MSVLSTAARVVLLPLALVVTVLVVPVGPAAAAVGSTLTLTAPASARAGVAAPFTMKLVDDEGAPIVGATVSLQRTGPTATPAGSRVTDATGTAVISAVVPLGSSTWQASYAGNAPYLPSTSTVVTVVGNRYASSLRVTGQARLVDERSATLSVVWSAGGFAVSGPVTIQRKLGAGPWANYTRLTTASNGRTSFRVTPRVDSRWRAVSATGPWWTGVTSPLLYINNVPPIRAVGYPKRAPHPKRTAPQARARGAGANAVVTGIPQSVWNSMTGRSWHSGCPVGRSGLRLLRINYWGFDGYRYRGEMVLATAVAQRASAALQDMYRGRFPIRRMYRVDRFGWSKRLNGANDYASMRADNTSAFNCRSVVNNPGVLSPHARGRAVDLNTWENPYRSRTGLVPNSWWASRSHPKIAWRSSSHPVVKIWRSHGFRWTYGNVDSQHVDGRTPPLSGGFVG